MFAQMHTWVQRHSSLTAACMKTWTQATCGSRCPHEKASTVTQASIHAQHTGTAGLTASEPPPGEKAALPPNEDTPGSPAASGTGNAPPPGLPVLCMGMALGTRLGEGQG